MMKEEIYYLKKIGIEIRDEKEAVTTDSIDKYPDIYSFLEELNRITEDENWKNLHPLMKQSVYTSCMMHYTIEVYRKNLISQEIFDKAMKKAEIMLRSIQSEEIIGFTLLYEGPHYLHPEIYPVYERAGYSNVVKSYIDIFEPLIQQTEKEKDFSIVHGKELQAYMDLYQDFMNLEKEDE